MNRPDIDHDVPNEGRRRHPFFEDDGYKCFICGANFKAEQALSQHRKYIHGTAYRCEIDDDGTFKNGSPAPVRNRQ
ncbi:Uncharacterised protein r2_g577 [Pycnogonum litorale]